MCSSDLASSTVSIAAPSPRRGASPRAIAEVTTSSYNPSGKPPRRRRELDIASPSVVEVRRGAKVTAQPREVPGKLVLEAQTAKGTSTLIVTQARAAALQKASARGTTVDIEWMLAEIKNHHLAAPVAMVCIDNVGLLLTDLEY